MQTQGGVGPEGCAAPPSIQTWNHRKQQLHRDLPSCCVCAWGHSLFTACCLTKEPWNPKLQWGCSTITACGRKGGKASGPFPRKISPPLCLVGCRMSKVPSHVPTREKSIITTHFSLWSMLNTVSVQPCLSQCQILLNEVYPAFPAWLNIVHPGQPERILYFANIINGHKLSMVCGDNGIDTVMPRRQRLGFRESFILCAALAISPVPFLNNFSFYFTSYAGIMPPAVYIKNALYMCWKHWVLCCWQGRKLLCLRSTLLYYYHFCLI